MAWTLVLAMLAAVGMTGRAQAATPTLVSVGHERMHPTASLSAPGATDVTVYISSRPDRATDGHFLSENSADIDFLTADEVATGRWMDADQLKPGTYWVMLSASTFPCPEGTDCVEGFSNVLELRIAKPKQRFKARIKRGYIGTFELKITPAGETVPYKLCWNAAKGRKCKTGSVLGTDWNDSASDPIFLAVDDLKLGHRTKVTFKWYVRGKRVAKKTVRIRNR
jgi:hypothetical protein